MWGVACHLTDRFALVTNFAAESPVKAIKGDLLDSLREGRINIRHWTRNLLGRDRLADLEARVRSLQAHIEIVTADLAHAASLPPGSVQIETKHPVAVYSDDHIHPKGTGVDNTRCPRFVGTMQRAIGDKLAFLDLGCSGGGLVFDFLLAGHDAYGIDGSDFSAKNKRAMWGILPDRLFTADVSKPFRLHTDGTTKLFNVISAWEMLEHIGTDDLETVFQNIDTHLHPDGVFIASVATEDDFHDGVNLHKTVQPRTWWLEQCSAFGFETLDLGIETEDFPRGSGNPIALDWSYRTNPEKGFHLVLRRRLGRV